MADKVLNTPTGQDQKSKFLGVCLSGGFVCFFSAILEIESRVKFNITEPLFYFVLFCF